jgi:hypothetical protein
VEIPRQPDFLTGPAKLFLTHGEHLLLGSPHNDQFRDLTIGTAVSTNNAEHTAS